MRLLIIIFFFYSLSGYAQENESCKLIVARWKLNRNKSFSFREGIVASMKVNDTVYIIPRIEEITWDSIVISKRIYFNDNHIEWIPMSFQLQSLRWINWDGIPRKKVRSRFFRFEVEEVHGLNCE